ncbi:MAG: D-glycero-beta-D-manno-heptose-7-phosphate kinase [Candidatus Cloacimonetes bacterium]|nr:D-glycero-beta-D-manno-heptose-7-phosphate kinase [Candidatus Cloacimonadota bacterium]
MIPLTDVHAILDSLVGRRVIVLGDLMLDHYLWGKAERISAEAPVPVVEVSREEHRLGGAANVVHNIIALGGIPVVMGLVGADSRADTMRKLFAARGVTELHLVIDPDRPTTLKSRVIAHNQQVVRVDFERTTVIPAKLEDELLARLAEEIPRADAVLLEDYNKGLLSQRVIRQAIALCRKHDKIVTVDPKFRNFFDYEGCTVFKPNVRELEKNLGTAVDTDEEFLAAAHELLERIDCGHLIITRGEKGLSIFTPGQEPVNIPTFAQEVYDVSGAGDTVIGALTLCLAAGCAIADAAIVANHAAGSVCGKVGIHPAHPDDILSSFRNHQAF